MNIFGNFLATSPPANALRFCYVLFRILYLFQQMPFVAGLIWGSLLTAMQPLAGMRPLCEGTHCIKRGGGEVG